MTSMAHTPCVRGMFHVFHVFRVVWLVGISTLACMMRMIHWLHRLQLNDKDAMPEAQPQAPRPILHIRPGQLS
jgi:hypothetical protein